MRVKNCMSLGFIWVMCYRVRFIEMGKLLCLSLVLVLNTKTLTAWLCVSENTGMSDTFKVGFWKRFLYYQLNQKITDQWNQINSNMLWAFICHVKICIEAFEHFALCINCNNFRLLQLNKVLRPILKILLTL